MPDVSSELPVIDVGDLVHASAARGDVARRIGEACRAHGFFYVTGHGVAAELMVQLETFKDLFGRAPDFVDGHQHAQLFPQARDA